MRHKKIFLAYVLILVGISGAIQAAVWHFGPRKIAVGASCDDKDPTGPKNTKDTIE